MFMIGGVNLIIFTYISYKCGSKATKTDNYLECIDTIKVVINYFVSIEVVDDFKY